MKIIHKAVETAHYLLNQRPLYVEPRGSQEYREARTSECDRLDRLGRELVIAAGQIAKTEMLGANYSDYYLLHRYVTIRRPSLVLELGTDITTAVLAYAMCEAGHGRIVTVDHIQQYSDETRDRLTSEQKARVDFVVSPAVGDRVNATDVMYYRNIPDGPYDMAFIDGPSVIVGRTQFPGVDALHIIARSDHPIDVIFDRRIQTLNHTSKWITADVTYDPALKIGVIASATKSLMSSRERRHALKLGSAVDRLGLSDKTF